MQQSKSKLLLEHVIVEKMGGGRDLRQDELDDVLRYGAVELFADLDAGSQGSKRGMLRSSIVRMSAMCAYVFQLMYW